MSEELSSVSPMDPSSDAELLVQPRQSIVDEFVQAGEVPTTIPDQARAPAPLALMLFVNVGLMSKRAFPFVVPMTVVLSVRRYSVDELKTQSMCSEAPPPEQLSVVQATLAVPSEIRAL